MYEDILIDYLVVCEKGDFIVSENTHANAITQVNLMFLSKSMMDEYGKVINIFCLGGKIY